MIYKSRNPPISVPLNLPIWTWLLDSPFSPLNNHPPDKIKGYTNALTTEHLSYFDVKTHSTHLSTCLSKVYGLRPGQTVALFSPNTVWYPIAMLGTLRSGGIVVGASPAYNVEEMTYALRTTKARFLMTMPESMAVASIAAQNAGIPRKHIFLLEGKSEGYTTMSELLAMGRAYGAENQVQSFCFPAGKTAKDVCAFLSLSSGTTGLPKAVMISHGNMIAQCLQIQQITPSDSRKILAVLPFFHITGLVHHLHLPILLNADVYLLPSYTLDKTLETICRYKIRDVLLVPPILIRLVRDQRTVSKYDLSHLRRLQSGAAPVSKEILALLEKRFPGTCFSQGYGMTESCSCIAFHPPDKYDYKYASRVGTIVASTEVRIVDINTGQDCGVNVQGEILARGPQVVMGYLDNEKATRETFDEDGFLHTGDLGMIDQEGFLTITDRLKELIKVKGVGVAPAELEDLLLGHPRVEDVAVLGIPDERAGERPKAFVVLKTKDESKATEVSRELIRYVRARKARHKWVTEVEIVDKIPKSASGKVLRRVLRDRMSAREQGSVMTQRRDGAKL